MQPLGDEQVTCSLRDGFPREWLTHVGGSPRVFRQTVPAPIPRSARFLTRISEVLEEADGAGSCRSPCGGGNPGRAPLSVRRTAAASPGRGRPAPAATAPRTPPGPRRRRRPATPT